MKLKKAKMGKAGYVGSMKVRVKDADGCEENFYMSPLYHLHRKHNVGEGQWGKGPLYIIGMISSKFGNNVKRRPI
jgi:hypothetical protein